MAKTFPGSDARVMIVVTPTDAANSAAMSLVTIPPVPTLLPGEETIGYQASFMRYNHLLLEQKHLRQLQLLRHLDLYEDYPYINNPHQS